MCVDATDPMKGNWLRYVNWACSTQEQNISPLETNRAIYYKVSRVGNRSCSTAVIGPTPNPAYMPIPVDQTKEWALGLKWLGVEALRNHRSQNHTVIYEFNVTLNLFLRLFNVISDGLPRSRKFAYMQNNVG